MVGIFRLKFQGINFPQQGCGQSNNSCPLLENWGIVQNEYNKDITHSDATRTHSNLLQPWGSGFKSH